MKGSTINNQQSTIANHKSKHITFLLPGFIKIPMGGVKVIIEYANHLAEKGHYISLVYPLSLGTASISYNLKKMIINHIDRRNKVEKDLYYIPDSRVNVLVVKEPVTKYIPHGDIIIAVGWQTARWVKNLPEVHGKKIYFIQSFETYFKNKKEAIQSYHYGLHKIAISQWIINELHNIGEECDGPLGNAIDPNEFFQTQPLKNRPFHVLMMYHPAKIKGAKEGIKALKLLKKQIHDLKVLFVAPRKPVHRIPSWVEVKIRPTIGELRELYNSVQIFFHPSRWEGWSLPPMEAMACGCAVVAVNNKGIREYLKHNENGLLSEIGDIKGMTENLQAVIGDLNLRQRIIDTGMEMIPEYSWKNIVNEFEHLLDSIS